MRTIIKSLYLCIPVFILLSCSDGGDETSPGHVAPTPITLGTIALAESNATTRVNPATDATAWQTGDELTIEDATYRYNGTQWIHADGPVLYMDDYAQGGTLNAVHRPVATDPDPNAWLDQSTAERYAANTHIAGTLKLTDNILETAMDSPLTHQNVDIVLTLTTPDGVDVDATFITTTGDRVTSWQTLNEANRKIYRAQLPADLLPGAGSPIFALTYLDIDGSSITRNGSYTLDPEISSVTAGQRLNITVRLHLTGTLKPIRATVTDFEGTPISITAPIYIRSTNDMLALAELCTAGNNHLAGHTVYLMEDITIPAAEWPNVGINLNGVFDGTGHTITMTGGMKDLFRTATIRNLNIQYN